MLAKKTKKTSVFFKFKSQIFLIMNPNLIWLSVKI